VQRRQPSGGAPTSSTALSESRRAAQPAFEERAEPITAAFFFENPRARLERRPVAHVPPVSALELGHPVAVLVLVVADDRPLHDYAQGRRSQYDGRPRRDGSNRPTYATPGSEVSSCTLAS
jgi:hypothetical protein